MNKKDIEYIVTKIQQEMGIAPEELSAEILLNKCCTHGATENFEWVISFSSEEWHSEISIYFGNNSDRLSLKINYLQKKLLKAFLELAKQRYQDKELVDA